MLTAQQFDTMSTKLAAASSPEEAAKLFHRLITESLAQEIANTLAKVKSMAMKANAKNAATNGWLDYVQGCTVDFCWPTPDRSNIQIGVPMLCKAQVEGASSGASPMISGEVSCGVSIRF